MSVKKKKIIYTVYAYRLAEDPSQSIIHIDKYPNGNTSRIERCWGWFHDVKVARQCIVENWTDLFEMCYYDHAFIEAVDEGILAHSEIIAHFKATYDSKTSETTVEELVDPPSPLFKNTYGFSMG